MSSKKTLKPVTKSKKQQSLPKVSLCSGHYYAEQIGDQILLYAHGYHRQPGYLVLFDDCSEINCLINISLCHVQPAGDVSDLVAPFSVSTSIFASQPMRHIVVVDAVGRQVVDVKISANRNPKPVKQKGRKKRKAVNKIPSPPVVVTTGGARGECFDVLEADDIISRCITGTFDPDKKLRQVGVVTPAQGRIFRECIVRNVDESGCRIEPSNVPNEPDTKLRVVRGAIIDKSSPKDT